MHKLWTTQQLRAETYEIRRALRTMEIWPVRVKRAHHRNAYGDDLFFHVWVPRVPGHEACTGDDCERCTQHLWYMETVIGKVTAEYGHTSVVWAHYLNTTNTK